MIQDQCPPAIEGLLVSKSGRNSDDFNDYGLEHAIIKNGIASFLWKKPFGWKMTLGLPSKIVRCLYKQIPMPRHMV